MRKRQIKKAFTLIEIVIVLVICSILIGILFNIYSTTADIAMRVKFQKQLGVGVVTMQTVMQNIVDTHTVDYNTLSGYSRTSTPGWTTKIPLLDDAQQKSTLEINGSGSLIYTTYSGDSAGESASILGSDVIFSGATFILSPSKDPKIDWCKLSATECFNSIIHPGFWLAGTLYPTQYKHLNFPVHTFFSFLKK